MHTSHPPQNVSDVVLTDITISNDEDDHDNHNPDHDASQEPQQYNKDQTQNCCYDQTTDETQPRHRMEMHQIYVREQLCNITHQRS